jgi:hypothetical protein
MTEDATKPAEPQAGTPLLARKTQLREIALRGVLALPTEDILAIYEALREHLAEDVPAEPEGDKQLSPLHK